MLFIIILLIRLKTFNVMFEKLFLLVKNNAGTAVIDNPVIAGKIS